MRNLPLGIRVLLPPPWHRLRELIAESHDEGFRFLVRLQDEFEAGSVCFDATGETLLEAFSESELVGVCGLTRDPYGNEPSVGRLRHLYVKQGWRRQGVGRMLVAEVVRRARPEFSSLVLRTDTVAAGQFYDQLGFERVQEVGATVTHCLNFD